jgi:hypothetical protein
MKRSHAASLLLLCCAWAAAASAEPLVPPRLAPLLDAAHDRIVQRTVVPSEEQKVGELRLVRRGAAEVVQTLLYTKVLGRVVGEIRRKELASWPADQPGHADALRYIETITAVQKQIWDRLPRTESTRDRRQKLVIEFVLSGSSALIAVGSFEMDETEGEVRVLRRELLVVLEPSRHYAERNMRLIVADSFHVGEAELGPLLEAMPLLRDANAR